MDQLINISIGQCIYIAGREHEFCNFVASESDEADAPDDLQFKDKRHGRIRVYSRLEFDDLYLANKLRWKRSIDRTGDEIPEEHCDDNTLRTIRHNFTKAFDEQPVPKTDAELRALYSKVLKDLKLSQEEWGRSGGALRRWINDRGEPGNPIETVANRVDGDQPTRNPVRSRRTPKKTTARAPKKTPDVKARDSSIRQPVVVADPFALFNRNELVQLEK